MNVVTSISWIDGCWETSHNLSVPIDDRGLKFADGIFETILILDGHPKLLKAHLQRWQQSAFQLGMNSPPTQEWLLPIIFDGIKRTKLDKSNGALRLNWSRGSSDNRTINIPSSISHRFWMELTPIKLNFNPISTIISRNERRNTASQLSKHKTFFYSQSIQAKYEAIINGYDDCLLLSSNGEMCCGTTGNLLIRRENEWLTPRIESGCLPGIMRQQGLNSNLIKEARINAMPKSDDQWLLINSLSCYPIYRVNSVNLKIFQDAKELWQSLINLPLN